MKRLTQCQRAGGDGGEHIAGTVLGSGNVPCPIGEQTAALHTGPAGVAGIPVDAGDDHALGTELAEGLRHLDKVCAVAVFPVGKTGQEGGFRQIGKQIVAPAAQMLHSLYMGIRHAGVELAVVTHGRVDDLQAIELVQNLADNLRLLGVG